jgi:thiamine biosynthesis lipoprotein
MKQLFGSIIILVSLLSCSSQSLEYHSYSGQIFGTTFSIKYEYKSGKSLDNQIMEVLQEFNSSLSNYDPKSVISRVNQNDQSVELDQYFIKCFTRAQEISLLTDGAFDITVAPLVNLWGFGFTQKDSVYPELIDSLLRVTGFEKVKLVEGRIVKENPGIMLDVSAIAKGYGVDVVSEFLESKGIRNYLVEIGGELNCKGLSQRNDSWRVGIDKPIESLLDREIQAVLALSNISMATSGNYRQFYVENGVKYSHTIDPKSGYPVRHSLLSATVLTKDCMSADAYATAFMVMGFEKAKRIIESNPDLEAFLIISEDADNLITWASEGAKIWIAEN